MLSVQFLLGFLPGGIGFGFLLGGFRFFRRRQQRDVDVQQEYDKDKVEDLKEGLLEALKNATNIRNLKEDESITICVFGGVSGAPGKPRAVLRRAPGEQDADREDVVWDLSDGPSARGTIMTIRVKKSDADAFAKGRLTLDDFRKKASITTYAGNTGTWSGGTVFGAP